MKKLVLIRHAEAELLAENLDDFDRPLTTAGKQEAAQMAAFLLTKASMPNIIISSPALRALTTAHIFSATLGLDNAKTDSEIYEAHTKILLRIINFLDDEYEVAGLVGHNPGVSNLLHLLTGKITTMPAGSWVEIELEAEKWAEVSSNTGQLIQYQHP